MGLDLCGQLCKCILICFNLMFTLVGCAMLGLGLWLRFSPQTRGIFNIDLDTQQFVIGVMVLIVLGAMILLASAFGNYGACNEKISSLQVFSVLLSVLAGLVIGAGVVAYIRSKEVGVQLAEFYGTVYLKYVNTGGNPSMGITLTVLQNTLKCCGLVGALDVLVKKTCPEHSFLETFTMPACPPTIVNLFEEKAPLVLGLFLGTAAMLVLALACSYILKKDIKRSLSSIAPYMLLSSPANTFTAPQLPLFPYQDPMAPVPLTVTMSTPAGCV